MTETETTRDCFCELGYECLDCARRRIARRELDDAERPSTLGHAAMTTESIVCWDYPNCPREHAGGMGGTPVHPPEGSVIVPGHFDHGVPSDVDDES